MTRLLLPALTAACLAGCTTPLPPPGGEPHVLHTLGSREGFTSPLTHPLRPACQALDFTGTQYRLSASHERLLRDFAATQLDAPPVARFLIIGQTPVDLPGSHARSLSERRAQAVRHYLIDLGLPAENLHTLGLGHDAAPAGLTGNSVVIYRQ
jgi:hypothetical protein